MAIILVIDDDARLREMLRRMLANGAHTVLEAENGVVGLKMVQAHRPAVVITDILMPEKEGIETIREIRRSSPAIKIIAMSGGGTMRSSPTLLLDAAMKLGADAVIEKPFRSEHVLRLVEDVLRPKD